MKRLVVILFLILAFPILLSGPSRLSNPIVTQASAQCIDETMPGNCPTEQHKQMPKKPGDRNHQFTPTDTFGSGLAALVSVLMIWMGLRR